MVFHRYKSHTVRTMLEALSATLYNDLLAFDLAIAVVTPRSVPRSLSSTV